MNEESFQLILYAGNSKSSSMEAISLARTGAFVEAHHSIKNAREELVLAHQIQTDFLVKQSRGINCQPDILMVHAQDHLNAALISLEMSEEIIHLYEELTNLKQEMKGWRK